MGFGQDAYLVALAALVFHEAAVIQAHSAQYGQLMSDPRTEAVVALEVMLKSRASASAQELKARETA